jgi:hypothetical protein
MNSSKICFYVILSIVSTRLLTYTGFPPLINFLNFPLALIVFFIHTEKFKNIDNILFYLINSLIFLIIASGFINGMGIINIILQILLYVSFFLIFISLVSTEWNKNNILFFKKGLASIFIINILFSYFQIFIRGLRHDAVHGIALNLGTAAHLNGAICLISFLFFIYYFEHKNKILSYFLAYLSLPIIYYSDAKQVFLVIGFSWITTLIISFKTGKSFLKEFSLLILGMLVFYYMIINNFIPVRDYNNIMTGFEHKFGVLNIILEKITLGQFFYGMGPGQTISRLATESYIYHGILESWGFIHSRFTETLVTIDYINYIISGSSFFSMKFSWAGIFGDIGIIGIIIYFLILIRINYKYSLDKIQKFIIISFFYYGFTFTWLEEPIFMILYLSFFGFIWQLSNYNKKKLKLSKDN